MIIYHRSKKPNHAIKHVYYWPAQDLNQREFIGQSAAPSNNAIEMAKANHRFVYSRIFGRVN